MDNSTISAKEYLVVSFPEEESTEVVSSGWLNKPKTLCSWPIVTGSKFKNLVKRHRLPNSVPGVKWIEYPCEVLGSYDTYQVARQKLLKASVTSNLDTSAPEEDGLQPRRLKKRHCKSKVPTSVIKEPSSSDSSNEESEELKSDIDVSDLKSLVPQPPSHHLKLVAPSSNTPVPVTQDKQGPSKSSAVQVPVPTSSQSEISSQFELDFVLDPSADGDNFNFDQLLSTNFEVTQQATITPILERLKALEETVTKIQEENSRFHETVLEKFTLVSDDLTELLQRTAGQSSQTVERAEKFPIPVRSKDEHASFLIWLDDTDNFTDLSTRLSIIGGSKLNNVVTRILHRIFSVSFAVNVSLTGRGKDGKPSKIAFAGTKLQSLVFEAVCKTNGYSDAQEQCINNGVKSYFKGSPRRTPARKSEERPELHSEWSKFAEKIDFTS